MLEVKYGRRLQAAFARPGGDALRRRIDDMSNEQYQAIIRLPGAELRAQLCAVEKKKEASSLIFLTIRKPLKLHYSSFS